MKTEKQPIGTVDLWSAYGGQPMKTKLWLLGGGVFEFCLPCFVFLAQTGSHIPAVPPAPFLGWWLGSIGEAGNCGKLRRSVVEGGWGVEGGSSGKDMHV